MSGVQTWALPISVDRPPPIWRRLEEVRRFAETRIRWCLGRGFVDFWYDCWCFDSPLVDILQMSDPPHMFLAEFYTDNGWDGNKLRNWLPDYLASRIEELQLHPSMEDSMVWQPSSNGELSVKSAWEEWRQRRNISVVDKGIWCPILPLKVSFFSWKLVRGFVPMDAAIKQRGISLASRCDCCFSAEESVSHFFLHGPVARNVWDHFARLFGLRDTMRTSIAAMFISWFFRRGN